MANPQVFKLPKQPAAPPLLRIEPFKGINLSVTPTQIDQHQSPEMLNMLIDQRGSLNKRTGYERVFPTSLGVGKINGMFEFKKKDGTIKFLLAHGKHLYTQTGSNQPVQLSSLNLLPPFTDWNLHVKANVISPYVLELNADTPVQGSTCTIPVLPNTPYTLSYLPSTNGGFAMWTYDKDMNQLSVFGYDLATSYTKITEANCAFMKIGFASNAIGHFTFTNPQLEQGNAATTFKPKGFMLSDNKIDFFVMNDKCYIMDGVNYLVYDGTTVTNVVPYIPTLTISGKPGPLATGTLLEDFNLLGAGFKEKYTGDGVLKDFALSLKPIDATPVIVKVNEVVKTLTTDYTVNATTGIITFVTAPSTGTNNVEITAYKTQATFPDKIKKCTFSIKFGGSNDTRMFVSGNPNFPEYVWRLGLNDPTYAPENGFYTFPDKVMGFAKQYDYLVVERESGKHQITFDLSSGEASFPSKPINDQVGTLAPNSIQIIENNPVSLSKDGVFMLTQSNVRDERNVQHISENVDARLLNEPNLNKAVSVDYARKYWIAVNGNVYIFDYSFNEWYMYDNINASGFIEMNGEFYFSSSVEGLVYRFYKESEPAPFNDDGVAINAYWISKQFVFGADELRKLVEKVFYSLKPMTRTSADIYYITNKKQSALVKTTRMDLLDFTNIDFNNWSFIVSNFPQEAMAKIKAKKITHFQLIIKNDKLDEGLGLLSTGIKWKPQSEIK